VEYENVIMKKWGKSQKGMTPVELLMAIAIIGVLIFIVVFFIERSLAFAKARDVTRFNHVQLILSSVLQYQIDTSGGIPLEIDNDESTWQLIGIRGQVCTDICENRNVEPECVYLDELVPKYLGRLPQDQSFTQYGPTGYYINKKYERNVVIVGACEVETSHALEIQQ